MRVWGQRFERERVRNWDGWMDRWMDAEGHFKVGNGHYRNFEEGK